MLRPAAIHFPKGTALDGSQHRTQARDSVRPRRSARRRTLRFAALAVAGAVTAGLVLVRNYRHAVDETFHDVDARQQLLVEETRDRISELLVSAESILRNEELLHILRSETADSALPSGARALEALGRSLSRGGLVQLLVLRADATVAASAPQGIAIPRAEVLAQLSVVASSAAGEPVWFGPGPVQDGSILLARAFGSVEPEGTVVTRIPLADLYANRLLGLGIGPTGYPWIMDPQGTILLAPPPSLPGSRPFEDIDNPDFLSIFHRMRTTDRGTGTYPWPEPDGTVDRRRLAFVSITFLDRRLIVAESASEREVLARLRAVTYSNALLGGIYLVLLLVAGTLVLRAERARRRRTEELLSELRQSEERYRISLNESPAAIFDVAPASRLVIAQNSRARELLGWGLEPPPDLTSLVPTDERARVGAMMDEIGARQSASIAEVDLLTHDGLRVPVELKGRLLGPADGSFVQFVAMDLRERKALESKLVAQDRLATLGLLTSGIAHEIKNPVGAVLVNAEDLRRRLAEHPAADDPERLEIATDILEAGERLRDVVSSLGVLGRNPDIAVFPVREAIDDALKIAWHQLRYRATIDKELGDATVRASRTELAQVFLNLLVNAAQAFDAGADPRRNRVSLRAIVEGDRVVVTVADNGPGIPPSLLAHVFDRFFTTKPAGEGTGLGLWIAASSVERIGGALTVDSIPGQGATFRVALPRAAV